MWMTCATNRGHDDIFVQGLWHHWELCLFVYVWGPNVAGACVDLCGYANTKDHLCVSLVSTVTWSHFTFCELYCLLELFYSE